MNYKQCFVIANLQNLFPLVKMRDGHRERDEVFLLQQVGAHLEGDGCIHNASAEILSCF